MTIANPGIAIALTAVEDWVGIGVEAGERAAHYALRAREAGATYPQIGHALGLTKSGARDLVRRAREREE